MQVVETKRAPELNEQLVLISEGDRFIRDHIGADVTGIDRPLWTAIRCVMGQERRRRMRRERTLLFQGPPIYSDKWI